MTAARVGKTVVIVMTVLLAFIPAAARARSADFAKWFKGDRGAFVLDEPGCDRRVRHNEKRCAERFSPCSTFKIPNALIALETGVVKDAETVIKWTPELFNHEGPAQPPFDEWMRDHTLRSAMRHSVVWYFQEIARLVGEARYVKFLDALEYGNRDISSGLDRFWLTGSLKVSANEQIEFLRRLYTGQLPVSERSIHIVKSILVLEDTSEYRLSAKTGTGPLSEGGYIGWFVGYVERGGDVSFFALNVEGSSYESISKERRLEMTKGILKELNILP